MKKYDFAYLCVNILRKEETKKTISSLKKFYPNCKIYIGDQDETSDEMINFYNKYDINYQYFPFDSGLPYVRNVLINKIKESYIMWGDNDFIFTEDSNIYNAIDLLKAKNDIGIVGGLVIKNNIKQHYERIILYDKNNGIIIYIPLKYTNPIEYNYKGNIYYYCDMTFNYAIAKNKVFKNKKIKWNESIKVKYEHTDLFLRIKLYSKYKVVYFPNMKIHHVHLNKRDKYFELRNRKGDAIKFANSWGLKMNFTIGDVREIYGKEINPIQTLKQKITKKL